MVIITHLKEILQGSRSIRDLAAGQVNMQMITELEMSLGRPCITPNNRFWWKKSMLIKLKEGRIRLLSSKVSTGPHHNHNERFLNDPMTRMSWLALIRI
jgi:hypothetical protein